MDRNGPEWTGMDWTGIDLIEIKANNNSMGYHGNTIRIRKLECYLSCTK